MQEPITYRTHFPTTLNAPNRVAVAGPSPTRLAIKSELKKMVEENAVIVFGRKGCCMSYVVKRLLQGLGANPAVCDVEDRFEDDVVVELQEAKGGAGAVQLPAVFIGGRWSGGLDRIMASHITGELTPLLKQAGALWL